MYVAMILSLNISFKLTGFTRDVRPACFYPCTSYDVILILKLYQQFCMTEQQSGGYWVKQ